jgi:hypothetical protein
MVSRTVCGHKRRKRFWASGSGFLRNSRMEARARAKPSEPPESDKDRDMAEKDQNWRTKRLVEAAGRELPFKKKEVHFEDKEGAKGVELPYKNVKPVETGARTQPVTTDSTTRNNINTGFGEKQYRIRAPIQRDGVTEDMIDQIHNTEVMVRLGDLYGISRELREGERLKLTRVRQPVLPSESPQKPLEVAMTSEELDGVQVPAENIEPCLQYDALDIDELPQVEGVFITETAIGNVPAGSLVAKDPILQYLESLGEDTTPKQIFVARDSAPLRVTFPNINYQSRVESILDTGSQIVSMALDIAREIGLIWDPKIQIFMQSANRTMERSVGLARNVPFQWGELVVYLQVHIIKGPAYKVLLGRPFDTLTKSQIDNQEDGGQVITLTDPNTGKVYAVPTFDRTGAKKISLDKPLMDVMDQDGHQRPRETLGKGFRNSSRN